MGTLLIGFIIGTFLTVPATLMASKIVKDYRLRKKVAIFHRRPETRQNSLTWVHLKNNPAQVKGGGSESMPLLHPDFMETFEGRPCYFIDTQTGEPYRNGPPLDGKPSWPTARDRLQAYRDVREKKVATSGNTDAWDYGKIGVILGGVTVLLGVVIIYLLTRSLGF